MTKNENTKGVNPPANFGRGFNNGFQQLRMKDRKEAVKGLFIALGISNRNSFSLYRRGKCECKVSQAIAVEIVR